MMLQTQVNIEHFPSVVASSKLDSQLDKLQLQRYQQAEIYYLDGVEKLKQAEQTCFKDKQLMIEAYQDLSRAIQKNRKESRYLTAMAYLLILTGHASRAGQYLGEVLRIDPNNKRALLLKQSLADLAYQDASVYRLTKWDSFESLPLPETSEDYDWLYDEVEFFIREQMPMMMSSQVSTEVAFEEEQVEAQEQMCRELLAFKQLVQDKFEILEQELDTDDLLQLITPLDVMTKRYGQVLIYHFNYQEISHTITDIKNYVKEQIRQLKSGVHVDQDVLENLLDQCDIIADQLDNLESVVNISKIENDYEDLLNWVEDFQSLWEE